MKAERLLTEALVILEHSKGRPASYAALYPLFTRLAREKGYALGLHGSLMRDLDVIAVAWTDQAAEPGELAEHLRAACGGSFTLPPSNKPHGRIAYVIYFCDGLYLDLSVIGPRPCH